MKYSRLLPCLLTLCPLLRPLSAADIPALNWTERSDWINVRTDLTPPAIGDGDADDTAAIQSALNAAGTPTYPKLKTVYLPPGVYKITNSLTWRQCTGVALVGCGRNTVITWHGASGGTMFLSDGATYTRYTGITWDGRNLAAHGYYHHSTNFYETRIRHDHEKFLNFIDAAIRSYGGGANGYTATAETSVWNCLFSRCAIGFSNGTDQYNSYAWILDGCEFLDCGTGIRSLYGKTNLYNCRFERSTAQDIHAASGNIPPAIVRRCISKGSRTFFTSGNGSGTCGPVFQNCLIDSYTFNPAIYFCTNETAMVFDCKFTNPPNSTPPIQLNVGPGCSPNLIQSNNFHPSSSALFSSNGTPQIYNIPAGSVSSLLVSADRHFLKETIPAEGSILDVKAAPYNAVGNNVADDTLAIQNAINDARSTGKIVYLPVGNYRISATLNVSGGNYTIQGTGFHSTNLIWAGLSNGVMMEVTNPQNIRLQQLEFRSPETTTAIRQTGTGDSNITYDGVYSILPNGGANSSGRGFELIDLPANSRVYLQHLDGPLTVDDCGRAQIFGKSVLGNFRVKGADYPKTGFLGFNNFEGGHDLYTPGNWDILIQDNQDAVIGWWYSENSFPHLRLERGLRSGAGRFTIQSEKQHSVSSPDFLSIDNYEGRIMYAPGFSQSNLQNRITHVGSNPVDIILAAITFRSTQDVLPTFTTGTGARQIILSCLNFNTSIYPPVITEIPNQQPTGWNSSLAASLDHLRELGNLDLNWNYGLTPYTGPMATWKLDEAVWNGALYQVLDSSGSGYHGTAYGGATTSADAHAGRSGSFDGNNDAVKTSYGGSGLTGITLSAWVKRFDSSATERTILGSDTSDLFRMFVKSGQLQCAIGNLTQGSGCILNAGAIPYNTWTHVAVTWNPATGFAAYVNRTLVKTAPTNLSTISWPALNIGATRNYKRTYRWFGLIDHPQIWNRALTPAEINAIP